MYNVRHITFLSHVKHSIKFLNWTAFDRPSNPHHTRPEAALILPLSGVYMDMLILFGQRPGTVINIRTEEILLLDVDNTDW